MNVFKKIFRPRVGYEPLIEVRIFKDAILSNLQEFKNKHPQLLFAPVLKSNAYGHGLVLIAKILDKENLPFFMVDSFFEALQLKRDGIKTKILILGYNRKDQILNNKLKNVSFGIIDFEQLKIITSKLKRPQTFHLKIDTGMHRQGILVEQVNEAIKLIKQNKNFILEGVCSHFADSDGNDQSFTLKQIEEWNKIVKVFKMEFSEIKFFHTSNTAGSFYSDKIEANVNRLGIGLFGINPKHPHLASPLKGEETAESVVPVPSPRRGGLGRGENLILYPTLEMVSIVSSIKTIKAGEVVGYGITFSAPKNMVVATVPVGYNEGVDRRLSNKGVFKIGDVECPIVGRVSMNMSSVDISECSAPIYRQQDQPMNGHATTALESEVIVISKNPSDKNSVENIAKLCDCLPYEVLVKIPSYLKRKVI